MNEALLKDAVLRIGEVCGIEGRKVFIRLDKEKNSSDLLFKEDILKNISVGSYVEIRKGFLSIIGKAEGEKLEEDNFQYKDNDNQYKIIDKNKRTLVITLSGFINSDGRFIGGIKELPLIGNEAYILTEEKVHAIHDLIDSETSMKIQIARTDIEEIPIKIPVDGLFNSHIAIFGNTGSGKSNTLASLYQSLFIALHNRKCNYENFRFFIFDFNGEYINENCLTRLKKVLNLSTRNQSGDKIPISFNDLMDIEALSILLEATEKTQKPFLKRTLKYYKKVKMSQNSRGENNYHVRLQNLTQDLIKRAMILVNKDIAYKIIDYIEKIYSIIFNCEIECDLRDDFGFHDTNKYFYHIKQGDMTPPHDNKFADKPEKICEIKIYNKASEINSNTMNSLSDLTQFYIFILIQFIFDLLTYKINPDHIIPVINRFEAKQDSIENIFIIDNDNYLWHDSNIIVLNLHDVNIEMKKTIPLLMAKYIYTLHKQENNQKILSIIIDEAHNILSKSSFRETEDWKDYRLETFEEIIKEGRKYGVFVTIASQRPNDISDTIISQAHNYFIHQLINQKDLLAISNSVSYIDRITEESIPTLPVGTCIFSGIITPMPLKIKIDELPNIQKPNSHTLTYSELSHTENSIGGNDEA